MALFDKLFAKRKLEYGNHETRKWDRYVVLNDFRSDFLLLSGLACGEKVDARSFLWTSYLEVVRVRAFAA